VAQIEHFNITIEGKVQGVYFRASAKQMADLLGVKGFTTNLDVGHVYIEAEGNEHALAKFVQWCHHGPEAAEVKYVSVIADTVKGFDKFDIKR
jgi:acylphosphatase